ncbi:MAG: CpcT/CpeT family chromophore lyase [Rhodospirillaceae bacterium]|nr:CpcT/CpeT family chromophore lyase [Rhodospirillaceae bacterium]
MPTPLRATRAVWTAALTALLLPGAAPARAETPADVQTLIAMLVGEYDNREHVAVEATLPDSPATGKKLVKASPRYLFIHAVDVPATEGADAYLEWREGERTGPMRTQRIWSYVAHPDHIEMRFYTLLTRGSDAMAAAADKAAAARGLTADDLFTYHDSCVFKMKRTASGFHAELEPGRCVMLQRSQNLYMTVDATVDVTAETVREYTEFDYARRDRRDEYEDRVYKKVTAK